MKSTSVKGVQANWLEKLPPLRVPVCLAIQTAVMLACFAVVGAGAYALNGAGALAAAAVASGVCWLGACLALLGTALCGRGTTGPLNSLLIGLVFNAALPFGTGLVLSRAGGALAEGGVFGLIVICFQVALVSETLLSLCLLKTLR